MILADIDIERAIVEGRIVIDPAPDLQAALGPCSIDLRLGYEFVAGDDRRLLAPGEAEILLPRGFVLGATLETVTLPPDLAGRLEGRSSLARQGIIVHGTAGLIAPGSHGVIVLEFANLGPRAVTLRPGDRICALAFEPLSTPSSRPYRGQYHGQRGP